MMTASRNACAAVLAVTLAGGCALRAQEHSEVQSTRVPSGTLEQRQQQTGVAYRRLQQLRYEKTLAEQDYINAEAAYDRTNRELDEASKAYAAAQARERAAAQDYERGLKSVEEVYGSAPKGEPRPR